MDSSSLSIQDQLGFGGQSAVHKVTNGTTVYACKVFFTKKAFESEKAAYERIQHVAALKGRVPTFHNVLAPFVILLEYVEGTSLLQASQAATISRSRREEMKKQLSETLQLLHHEAGVYHCDLSPQNIMVTDSCVRLIDFSMSEVEQNVPEEERVNYARNDRVGLAAIFFELGLQEATREALGVIDRMRHSTPSTAFENEKLLAEILPRTRPCIEAILNAIIEVIPAPIPSIALWTADGLASRRRYEEAGGILRASLARCETPDSGASVSHDLRLRLRERAAEYAAKDRCFDSCSERPSAEELYEDAVRFYLCSSSDDYQCSAADEKVLDIRLSLVKALSACMRDTDALRVCVRALEEAGFQNDTDGGEKIDCLVKKVKHSLRHVEDRELWEKAAKLIGYDDKTFEQCRAEDWRSQQS